MKRKKSRKLKSFLSKMKKTKLLEYIIRNQVRKVLYEDVNKPEEEEEKEETPIEKDTELVKKQDKIPLNPPLPPTPPPPPNNTDGVEPESPEAPEGEESDENAPPPDTPEGPITKEEAKQMIKNTKGKFFTVVFIKKDGTTRILNGRLGVKAYLKGGELRYNPEEFNLIPVFDQQKRAYRMINVNTIQKLVVGGKTYDVQ